MATTNTMPALPEAPVPMEVEMEAADLIRKSVNEWWEVYIIPTFQNLGVQLGVNATLKTELENERKNNQQFKKIELAYNEGAYMGFLNSQIAKIRSSINTYPKDFQEFVSKHPTAFIELNYYFIPPGRKPETDDELLNNSEELQRQLLDYGNNYARLCTELSVKYSLEDPYTMINGISVGLSTTGKIAFNLYDPTKQTNIKRLRASEAALPPVDDFYYFRGELKPLLQLMKQNSLSPQSLGALALAYIRHILSEQEPETFTPYTIVQPATSNTPAAEEGESSQPPKKPKVTRKKTGIVVPEPGKESGIKG